MTDFATGVCLIVAAIAMIVRSLLLAPKNEGWPPAPSFVRVSMFLLGATLVYRGVDLTAATWWGVTPVQVGVPLSGAMVSVALANYCVMTCLNVYRQKYPRVIWDRVERLMAIGHANNAWWLVLATRAGFKVYVPERADPTPISIEEVAGLMAHDLPPAKT